MNDLRKNLMKHAEVVSTENLKDCQEKGKNAYKKGDIYCVHGLGDSKSLKISIFFNLIYRFNTNPVQTPANFLVVIDYLMLKMI